VVVPHTKRGGGEILEERIWGELMRVLPKKYTKNKQKKSQTHDLSPLDELPVFFFFSTPT
jgi:hypothetical protein